MMRIANGLGLACLLATTAGADGGAVRLRGQSDDWVLSVFTGPEPLRVGPADVSVLVQQRETGEAVLDVEVTLTLRPPAGEPVRLEASRAQATNKLLHSAVVDLPVAGEWALSVTVRRDDRVASLAGALPVAARASRLRGLGLVLAFPPLAIVLFACHQALQRRRVPLVAALLVAGLLAAPLGAQTDYPLTADSLPQAGVPAGRVIPLTWKSTIFPGTERGYWIYVPAQYRADAPAAVMVFQDGARYVAEDGRWRAPVVFDNLIHRGEMPVTIGVFVDPGVLPARSAEQQARYNRSFEYDGLGDRYARFLLEELLPEVARTYPLTTDPNLRAIGGSSSGGICAFTAAWNRPDAFRRVLSFIGSYTGLRGGDGYATLIRKTEPRPIRVFLQDGSRDLDIYSGSWWIGNQAMASALEYAGYDVRFVTGDRGHDHNQGSAILPDALRWLWRDWKTPIVASRGKPGAERHLATEVLDPGVGWQLVSEGHASAGGLAVDRQGDVYVADARRVSRIEHKTGKVTVFKEGTGGTLAMTFGPDGRLYVCQGDRRRIVAYSPNGAEATIADGVEASDLVVNARGEIWFTDPKGGRVWFVDGGGGKRVVHEGLDQPGGVMLSPDQALLTVADSRGRWVRSFQVGPDGALLHGEPFYRLETADESSVSEARGMTVDRDGFLYVATRLGLQIFDQPGRLNAILDPPTTAALASVVFGGPGLDTLYVTAGDQVFRRHVRRQGLFPGEAVKPPVPRL